MILAGDYYGVYAAESVGANCLVVGGRMRPLVAGRAMTRRCVAERDPRTDRRYGPDAGDSGEGSPNSGSFIHPRRQSNRLKAWALSFEGHHPLADTVPVLVASGFFGRA